MIDVHQHLVPVVFRSMLNSVGITGGVDRIAFGTDYPYMPDYAIGEFARQIQEYPDFDEEARNSIERYNALRLFPRFASAAA